MIKKFEGHRGVVNKIKFHPTYSIIASCSEDATIKIWDLDTGKNLKTLRGHTSTINDICFDSEG